jgi:hypothetical protein
MNPITVVCTGRGTHKLSVLGDVVVTDDGTIMTGIGRFTNDVDGARKTKMARAASEHLVYLRSNAEADPTKPSWTRLHMKCHRCTPQRHVLWRNDTAIENLRLIEGAGIHELDISALP